ncbi:MAG: hypothetical protein AVDCRST_MAG34-491, partial [uncultured Nocardioidaceae bacterium]
AGGRRPPATGGRPREGRTGSVHPAHHPPAKSVGDLWRRRGDPV